MKKAVNVIISDKKNKILVLKRSFTENHFPNFWDLPGGKVECNETIKNAAEREIKEESGLKVELDRRYFYIFHCQDRVLSVYGFKARFAGGDIKLSNEHANYKWISKKEYKNLKYTPSVKSTLEQFFKS